MKYFLILLAFPLLAHAGEAQLACDLERSKAEVQASTLAAPAAFGTLGQDPASGTKSVSIGLTQSLSGYKQAGLVRSAADARCEAIKAELLLDEHARFALVEVQRVGATAELQKVEEAITLAKINLELLDRQLEAQTITIMEHTAARQALNSLQTQRVEVLRVIAQPSLPSTNISLLDLIESARHAEAEAARLSALASASTGWDVFVSAGVREPQGGRASTYGTVGIRYSFGEGASRSAAENVGRLTGELASIAQGGYTQTVIRERSELTRLIEAENIELFSVHREIEHLIRVRTSLVGIETSLAQNQLRNLELQLKSLEAERAGTSTRLEGYRTLLGKL